VALVARYSVAEIAEHLQKHPVTIRLALEGARLHGTQSKKGGHWSVREDCLEAYLDGVPCAHQASNVRHIKSARSA
jgi:hypothetical protein